MFAMLVLPAVATDIPYGNNGYNSTTCNSGVLQNDSGTVRLRARYEPNQININWYNGDTKLNSTSNLIEMIDSLTNFRISNYYDIISNSIQSSFTHLKKK